jgi:hypothetical protein
VQLSVEKEAMRARLVAELSAIGPVLSGTLSERRLTCTHAGCHCHETPPKLHGPYWYLTRKVAGKTVSRSLTKEQATEYQVLIDNGRRLRQLVRELEALGLLMLEADPRSPKRRR